MPYPEWIDQDLPVADEPIVWPPGPPRPYPWARVWQLSFLISGTVIGSVAILFHVRGVLDGISPLGLFVSILIGTGLLSFVGRRLSMRLQPGIPELTLQELSLWTFWVTLIAIPATLVITPIIAYLFPEL